MAKRNDFVFLDPPYIEDFDYQINYNIGEDLSNKFLSKLLDEVKKLDLKGVKWLMTQTDTPIVRSMLKKIPYLTIYCI
jgi:site-specific DNA-adenine methylase